MARRLGDRAGLATVLMRSYWSRGTSSLEEILAMLTEARRARRGAGRHRDPRRGDGLARAGVRRALATSTPRGAEVAALRETAEQTAQPFMLHVAEHYGSAIALCDGRLDEAEALAQRSHEWSRLLTGRDASGVHGIQMFSIRREQGRLAELAPVIRLLAGEHRRQRAVAAGARRRCWPSSGMEAEARRELGRGRGRRARRLPRVAVAGLADLPDRRLRGAGRRGDRRRCSTPSSSRSRART